MPESILPDPTRTAAPPAGSTTRNGEPLTAERTPSGTLSVPPEPLPRPFGRYQLRQLLGRGGMGSVYLAHDAQLDRLVALKMPRPFGDDPTLWRERFLTEARAAATLSHPNICPVHDVGEHDGQPYLTMAYIDGETLAARLKRDGRLPVSEAVGLVATVARAMAEAHARGIVHRDLKPGNLLLDRRGRPVVTDFGLALRASTADDLRLTLTGVAMGTPAYMPPEQAGGDVDAIGPASDVYALGVMLFELLTGRVPFRGRTFGQLLAQIERDPPPLPSSLADGVPPALDAIILTALAKAPADRFPSAAEFADALDQFQAGDFEQLTSRYGAALAAAEPALPAPAPPMKRTRRWPAVAAGFLGLLVLLTGVIYVTTDKGELKVEFLDPDTGKPIAAPKNIDVKVNGQRVILDPDGKPITVRAGEDQMLVVTGEDFVTESQTFTLKRWKDATVRVSLVPKERLAKRPDPVVPPPEVKPGPKQTPEVKTPPPKPVAFPKDKTLIEAPGWQILTDATKEQMEVWLDERKKAKHSVTWLDLTAIDGNPCYTAVAALDDRQPKWTAMTQVDDEDDDALKGINFDANWPKSLATFSKGQKRYSAFLWMTGHKRWSYSAGEAEITIGKTFAPAVVGGFVKNQPTVLRPFRTEAGNTQWAGVIEPTRDTKTRIRLKLAADELGDWLAEERKEKRRPIGLAAVGGEALVFSVVSETNVPAVEWEAGWDLTVTALAAEVKARTANGFRPDTVTAYPWDGAVRYCVVWVKDPPKPTPYPKDKVLVKTDGYETLLDATKEQMQAWLDDKKKAGHSVLWLDAYPVGEKPVYSAVVALDDRQPKWVAMLEVPYEQMAPAAMRRTVDTEANSVRSLSGFFSGTTPFGTVLWHPGAKRWGYSLADSTRTARDEVAQVKDSKETHGVVRGFPDVDGVPRWATYYEITPGVGSNCLFHAPEREVSTFLEEQKKKGFRPTGFSAVPQDGEVKFTVVVHQASGIQDWSAEWGLSATKFASSATEKAKGGFRPESITAYAWDGAVRYCVVWVKDPPTKPDAKTDEPKK